MSFRNAEKQKQRALHPLHDLAAELHGDAVEGDLEIIIEQMADRLLTDPSVRSAVVDLCTIEAEAYRAFVKIDQRRARYEQRQKAERNARKRELRARQKSEAD